MSLTLTYDSALSRIKVEFAAAPTSADYAHIERSTDGINWETVRGGTPVTITAGAGHLYDYEFAANVLNTYRVSYIDSAPVAPLAASVATGNNTSVTPALPAGPLLDGDLIVGMASIRNSGTGTVNLPAGWTSLVNFGNARLVARAWSTSAPWAAPTFTFAGGAANADTLAFLVPLRGADIVPRSVGTSTLNASAQPISTPPIGYEAGDYSIRLGWKQDDMTSAIIGGGWAQIALASSTAGDDASQVAVGILRAAAGGGGTTDITVTGGVAAISRGLAITFRHHDYVSRETQTVTPNLDRIWIKNVLRPHLNIAVTVVGDPADAEWEERAGLFTVVGRTYPVAITDVRGGSRQTLTVTTETLPQAKDLLDRLMGGDVIFLHTPDIAGDCPVETRYALVGNVQRSKPKSSARTTRRYFDLALTEVAKPVSTLVGATITWADVVATYATWADVIAAKATWSDLLDTLATPGEVIVP